MANTHNKEKPFQAFNERLSDDNWDLYIARKVLKKHNKKQIIYSSSVGAGIIVILSSLFFIETSNTYKNEGEILSRIINHQTSGLYSSVFQEDLQTTENNLINNESQFDTGLEGAIEIYLDQRL
jgi:hypothetical protein